MRIMLLLALLTAGCGESGVEGGEGGTSTTMQEADLSAIGQELGLVFPGDCRVLGYSSEEGMDTAWRLKLDCDAAEAKSFLAAPPLEGLDFRDAERYLLGPNEGWWNPEEPDSLPTVQVERPDARFLNVGFAERDSSRTTVYLMWHTT